MCRGIAVANSPYHEQSGWPSRNDVCGDVIRSSEVGGNERSESDYRALSPRGHGFTAWLSQWLPFAVRLYLSDEGLGGFAAQFHTAEPMHLLM